MWVLISKWGSSLGLRLLNALTEQIGVSDGQKVEARADGGRIIVEPVPAPLTWDWMFENTTAEAIHEAWEWGEDVGREIVDD